MKARIEKLLTVEESFPVKHRGVILAPAIAASRYSGAAGKMFVLLRKPDGSEARVPAVMAIPMGVGAPTEIAFTCMLLVAAEDEVPVGSEIFRFVEEPKNA